jgi:hypothetical protein
MSYTKKKKNAVAHSPSDGSELIPASVQANTRREETKDVVDVPVPTGYTVDDEGITNNYAIEPDMSSAEYPSPKQQRRYVFLGAAAILFVILAFLIAFAVS